MNTLEKLADARHDVSAAADRILINAGLIQQLLVQIEPPALRVQINSRVRTIIDQVQILAGGKS